jgi:hypothetical protein
MGGKCVIHERHTDIGTKFLLENPKKKEYLRGIYISGKINKHSAPCNKLHG